MKEELFESIFNEEMNTAYAVTDALDSSDFASDFIARLGKKNCKLFWNVIHNQ